MDDAWEQRSVTANEEQRRRLGISDEDLEEPDENHKTSSGIDGVTPWLSLATTARSVHKPYTAQTVSSDGNTEDSQDKPSDQQDKTEGN